jgi:hypothetical protein
MRLRWPTPILCLALVLLSATASAFSIREWLGLEEDKPAAAPGRTEPASANWALPAGTDGGAITLEMSDMQGILGHLNTTQRQTVLGSTDSFRKMVRQEADNRAILAAALSNKLQDDPETRYLMQRGAENVLREVYLNRLIAGKIPADFPTAAQVREYYDKNKEKFVVAERVNVWQIFLPVGAKGENAAAQQKQAEAIVKELNENKIDFPAAAQKHSRHEQSRYNGGYMGLVSVSDLKPDIRKALMAADEGRIVGPIKSETGIHIMKRGSTVAAQPISFEQSEAQIRQLLSRQARAQLRKAILEQARTTYPLGLEDDKIEEWRLRLKTNTEPAPQAEAKPAE